MTIRYQEIPVSSHANNYYRVVMNFFKFTYFFNIRGVVHMHGFLDTLAYPHAEMIKEVSSSQPLEKFENYFKLLSKTTNFKMIYLMEPKMYIGVMQIRQRRHHHHSESKVARHLLRLGRRHQRGL
jgi:hypothetical protein